ncbi:hypothetical protein [Plantibacter sp. lyk4-40-MEA-4]|uniref:hypothetical protein n=1 Tax=Plantibacter sp. lyk4-40-MEA-4 TaxID=3040298 RepID=UPI002549E978|nr:hypothetical protein [Plantibacter sp. lyk4-40-MEA-4]
MTVAGIVIMAAGSLTMLVGIVAQYRSTRVVDEARRARAFFLATCLMLAGFVIGYLGVCVDTGQPPSAAVTIFVVVAGGALALWRIKTVRADEARRRNTKEQP